jgi:curved DNA-binding protein CbpA
MAGPNFYEILGVARAASQDEIRSAHRELVKKYHPDLFPGSTQKARANKKLQQINEAYAVLSNAERRRQYDSRLFVKVTVTKPAEATSRSRSTATFRRPPPVTVFQLLARQARAKAERIRDRYGSLSKKAQTYYSDQLQKARAARQRAASQSTVTAGNFDLSALMAGKFAGRWRRWFSFKTMAAALGVMIFVLMWQAMGKEPEITVAWTLWESMVIETARSDAGLKAVERNWAALGHHGSQAQCAESLKQRVAVDKQGGSQVFLDDRTGSIAMTIYLQTEAALAEELLREKLKQGLSGADREFLERQARDEALEFVKKNGLRQRVKHYQCRETQLVKTESWLRQRLRQIGLIS